jgi:hypothetical protein
MGAALVLAVAHGRLGLEAVIHPPRGDALGALAFAIIGVHPALSGDGLGRSEFASVGVDVPSADARNAGCGDAGRDAISGFELAWN